MKAKSKSIYRKGPELSTANGSLALVTKRREMQREGLCFGLASRIRAVPAGMIERQGKW